MAEKQYVFYFYSTFSRHSIINNIFSNFCRYGLIKLQKPTARLQAFASDSDSDDGTAAKKISIDVSSSQKRQAKIIQEDALKEDPTIYQYDEVYDEMATNREEAKKAKTTEIKKAKYIDRLLVAAEKRKLEHESRLERKVQKERDAEGDKYKDKEVFVTSSYRAKLEALKIAEEDARREEYLEQIGDVRKQGDLSGFYRHFYEQKLGNEKKNADENEPKADSKGATEKIVEKVVNKNRRYRRHSEHDDSNDDEDEPHPQNEAETKALSDRKVHIQSNIDADSDFSIDSSDSEDSGDDVDKKVAEKTPDKSKQITEKPEEPKNKPTDVQEKEIEDEKGQSGKRSKSDEADDTEKMPAPPAPEPEPEPKKPKIDIWKKRTVDDVYLAAVQRYFERKQQAG